MCRQPHERHQRDDRGDDERPASERPAGDEQAEADDGVEEDERDQQDVPLVVVRPRGVIRRRGYRCRFGAVALRVGSTVINCADIELMTSFWSKRSD